MDHNKLVVFESKFIRRIWHGDEWYFSVVDVCGVLTESPDAGAYWRKLKQRLHLEGSEVVTNCHGLNLLSAKRLVGWAKIHFAHAVRCNGGQMKLAHPTKNYLWMYRGGHKCFR